MNAANPNYDDGLILSRNQKWIPKPSIVEHYIRSGLIERYGMVYVEQMLATMTVDSCDEENLIIRVESKFYQAVICKRLLSDITQIVSDVYDIQPLISIVLSE